MSVIQAARLSVQVRLLGHPEVRRRGSLLMLPTRKALLLLAYLAVEGAQTRERLTALLWPDADPARGRANLRRTLAYVRDAVGREREVVSSRGGSLALAGVDTDVGLVREALEGDPDPGQLARAAAAWRGDLLEGLGVVEEELDGWLTVQREAWRRRLAQVSERLAVLQSESGQTMAALGTVERWLERDPLDEPAHRLLIRLHLVRGDRAAAIEACTRCEHVLDRELGVEPSAATRELAERARTQGALPQEQPAAAPARWEVPLVGRGPEHQALVAAWRRAEARAPQLSLLVGEAGMGKTRLCAEFTAWAVAAGGRALSGRAFLSGRRLAYQVLADALGRLPVRPGGANHLQLFQAVSRQLQELAAGAPLLLAIDDLQWVDPDSLELLLYAADALARSRSRALLLLAVREEDLASSSRLRDWTARATRELPLTEVRLQPLAEDEARRLVGLWPDPVPPPSEGALRQAAGCPLLLVETLRYLASGGDPAAIAPAARESMQARLRALGAGARELAAAAAVLEKPAGLATLAAVAGLDARGALTDLEELLERRVLAGTAAYSFSHELLRRAAYEALSRERRRLLHRAAATALDDARPGSAAEVALHAEMAGDLELAWARRMQAGREAMDLPAHRAAADHFTAAIAIRPQPGPAWLELGRAQELSGRSDAAAETYRMLLDRSRRLGEVAHEAAALARLAELEGRKLGEGAPEALLEEAADAAAATEDPVVAIQVALTATQVRAYRMELSGARVEAEDILRRARAARDPELVARASNLLAFVAMAAGDWERAVEPSRRAAAAYRRLGAGLMRIDSEGYETGCLVFLGAWRTGLRRARRALRDAERLQNPWAVCNLSPLEAWALHDAGQLEAALRSAERGMEAGVRAGFSPLRLMNAALAGRCRRELGDLDGALARHAALVDEARELWSVTNQVVAEELCADHAAAGDWTEAARWAGESVERWGEARMFCHLSLWTVADALLRAGEGFEPPRLPGGDRYRVVALRTRAVMDAHAGRPAAATAARCEALEIAERLELPILVRQLRAEVDRAPGPR